MPIKKGSAEKKHYALMYKWEFIRRNETYKSDYRKFIKKIGLHPGKYKQPPVNQKWKGIDYIPSKYEQEQEQYFYKEYGLGQPNNPDLSMEDLIKQTLNKFKDEPQIAQEIVLKTLLSGMFPYEPTVYCLEPYKLKRELSGKPPYRPWPRTSQVEVKINIQRPLKEIKNDLDLIIEKGRKILNVQEEQRDDRNHWVLYDMYLEIWDLKHKKRKTTAQILDHFDDGKAGIRDKIIKSIPAAEDMVNGGFRKIGNTPIPF